jgi:hypothetical protein
MAVTAAPKRRYPNAFPQSVVLEHFSVLTERKGRKKDAIILLCLVRGSYF